MRIVHRVSVSTTPAIRRELADAGVEVGEGFVTFELDETDSVWAALAPKILQWKAVDMPTTEFTRKECAAAEWLQMKATWHHGYPQPEEDDFGYLAVTYGANARCGVCGAGKRQKAPFRMKAEPRWGKKNMLQLNWVFDEFFAMPEFYHDVLEPLGVEARPVLDSSGGRVLENVLQLSVSEEIDVLSNSLPGEACSACGRMKYAPVVRGWFPRPLHAPGGHVVRTKEYFGSGHSAFQAVLVSKGLYSELRRRNVRGVTFVPAR